MELVPLQDETKSASGERPVDDAVEDANRDVVAGIRGGEMGRVVLPVDRS